MSEKIFLTYTNATSLPYLGSVLGYHTVLNYIDSNGKHHTLQGIPEHGFEHNFAKLGAFSEEEYGSDGTNNTDSPFKRLRSREEDRDDNVSLDRPYTMVAEGDDLSSRWALMKDFADEVNSTGYEYRPVSQNSNSFAGAALQRGGFLGPGNAFPERFDHQLVFDPARRETQSYRVPGFDRPLRNPIDTATPMPFPLSALVPPLVPANSLPAPDRPASFESRFANRSAIPAGNTDDLSSPVLRALQKYKTAAPADLAPASSAAPSFPSAGPTFGNRLEYALGAWGPDMYPAAQSRRVSSAFPNIAAGDPNQPGPTREPRPLLGILSGEPMSLSPLPPSALGLTDSSGSSDQGNWCTRLTRTPAQIQTSPAPSPLDDLLRGIDRDGILRSWFAQRQG
jgi:hypothetical protein